MTNVLKLALPAALAMALAGVAPAAAASAMPKQPSLASHVEGATLVAAKKKRPRQVRRYSRDYGNDGYRGSGWAEPYDTVGSVGYNGTPYGYNRWSGQQYNECVIDLGYGRVQACGGGNMR